MTIKIAEKEKTGSSKFRTTIYLPDEEHQMLNEIYSYRLLKKKKTDQSSLLCEAIRLLYTSEKPTIKT